MKVGFSTGLDALNAKVAVIPVARDEGLPEELRAWDESGQIERAMKVADFDGASSAMLEIPAPAGLKVERLLLAGAGKADGLDALHTECLGGRICAKLTGLKIASAAIWAGGFEGMPLQPADYAARLASGLVLRNYDFARYHTAKDKKPKVMTSATLVSGQARAAAAAFKPLHSLAEAVHMARDLVNEPGNVLYPESFAGRVKKLEDLGLEVDILDEKQLRKMGFGALLAVAQGSANPPRVAVMKWSGGKPEEAPLAFIGKGVTFDSGGISIKPSAGMEDMKGDMGGAAAVTGLMRALAARKARVNAVGIIGLVENMPDGRAQRPGDVVTSLSGQTIAVLNTDAEGRMVLADCLTYARETFKPALMINLATLTGAILVALGKEYAGMFSNDDELAGALGKAGEATGEKVWRMPLGKAYDKLIDHDVADMKNTGGRNAGSITAAQFLKRYVGETPWTHLDVAGTAMAAEKTDINASWGSGWGVRLLDEFVRRKETG